MDIILFVLLAAIIMRQAYQSAKRSQISEPRQRWTTVRKSLTSPNDAA